MLSSTCKQRYQGRCQEFHAGKQKSTRQTQASKEAAAERFKALGLKFRNALDASRPLGGGNLGSFFGDDSDGELGPNLFGANQSDRKGSNRDNRKRKAENWASIRPQLVEALLEYQPGREPICNGRCQRVEQWVHCVSFPSWHYKHNSFCTCFRDKAVQMVTQGYFPSSSVSPNICFSIELLELFHSVLMEGAISKRSFAVGLRNFHQRRTQRNLPELIPYFYHAFPHWLDVMEEEQRVMYVCPTVLEMSH